MIKKVLTNSAIYGLAPHVPRIVSVLLLPIMTAHLTDVDYGIAGTIAAYTMALSALSTLGVSAYLQVNFFKAKCQYKISPILDGLFFCHSVCGIVFRHTR